MNHSDIQRKLHEGQMKLPDLQGHLKTMKINYADTPVKPISNYEISEEENLFSKTWKHIKQLKHIKRLNGIPIIQQYTVESHCHRTGILFEYFALKENIRISPDELHWVNLHDLLESVTGDILYPAKNYDGYTEHLCKELELSLTTKEEGYHYLRWYVDYIAEQRFDKAKWNLFKAIDLLELMLFCVEEMELGSRVPTIIQIRNNCYDILKRSEFKSVQEWILK